MWQCLGLPLQAVLSWLADRPAVQWLAPLAKIQQYNYQASCITQANIADLSWAAVHNNDTNYHPLWAAGITGAGQVIGCGDSGVGTCTGCGLRSADSWLRCCKVEQEDLWPWHLCVLPPAYYGKLRVAP